MRTSFPTTPSAWEQLEEKMTSTDLIASIFAYVKVNENNHL